jgi:integral membrane protein (TIGR01906 family)
MKRRLSGVFLFLSSFCLCMAALLFSVYQNVYDRNFYNQTYAKLGIANATGMSQADLMKATDALLSYCQGTRSDLAVTAVIDGETRLVFSDPVEVSHMADVRALAQKGEAVKNSLFVAAACLLFLGVLLGRRESRSLFGPMLWGLGAGVLLMAALAAFAALDFDSFWTVFHYALFTNMDWQLNPLTSVLINMVPESFFFALVMRILLWFAGSVAVLAAVCIAGRVWERKRRAV